MGPEALARAGDLTRRRLSAVVLALACLGPTHPTRAAETSPDVKADIVLLVDAESGTTLFERNADKVFAPASLTKLVTAAVASDLLAEGRLTVDQDFTISEYAWRTGGAPSRTTSMFAPINSRTKVSDLLQGLIVQSANDAAIALAEGVSGTEGAFVDLMTKKAADLGMTRSVFRNASGLPDPDQKTTARDLVRVAQYLVARPPEFYRFFAQSEFTYNKIRQQNRNTLLNAGIGADGLAVAGQRETGFHIVGTAVQGGQRLILVLAGAKSDKERQDEARKALEWGFRNFEQVRLFADGEAIGEVSLFGGAKSGLKVRAEKPVFLFVQRGNRGKLSARVLYKGPVRAPVETGQAIGRLVVYRDEQAIQETPVIAAESVGVGSLTQRAGDAAYEWGFGKVRGWLGWK